MTDKNPAQAIDSARRIEMLSDFLENPAVRTAVEQAVPVTMPPAPGSLGFDVPLWVGLGIVGIWAALDAFAERDGLSESRCEVCGTRGCIRARFGGHLQDDEERASFAEIEDIRHLYAHNFAGHADRLYFSRPRHVLACGKQTPLSSGGQFNGQRLQLDLPNLRFYSRIAQKILKRFS